MGSANWLGVSMAETRGNVVEIEVRWPPFDSDSVIASELPIARQSFHLPESTPPPCELNIVFILGC